MAANDYPDFFFDRRQTFLYRLTEGLPVIRAESPPVAFQVNHCDACNRENTRYSLRKSFERDCFKVFWHDHLCFR
jgi:hypothetical protein